jgi:AcrR family transcriptional regulator
MSLESDYSLSTTKQRLTSEQRHEELVRAATPLFAERGFFGTPTVEIAAAAGLSHGYMFKVIGSKEKLFVAVVDDCFTRIADVFAEAATRSRARTAQGVLEAIGKSYVDVVAQPDLLLIQLHAAAAAPAVPAIRDAVRRGYERLVELVRAATGVDEEALQRFFAIGMLANVIAAIDADRLDAHWAKTLVGDLIFLPAA